MRIGRLLAVSVLPLTWFLACSSSEEAGPDGSGGGTAATGGGESGGTGGGSSGGNSATGGQGTGGFAGEGQGGSGGSATGGGNTGGSNTGGGTVVPDGGDWPDVVFDYDAGDTGTPDACASSTIAAEPIPLDLVILLDRSGSMSEPGYSANDLDADCDIDEATIKDSKWCRAINALMDFYEAPTSVGTGVGYRSYAGNASDGCESYGDLDVPLDIIAGGGTDPLLIDLEGEMNAAEPQNGTPTERALKTIIEFTLARQQENTTNGDTNRRVIGILVTDGQPQSCNTDTGDLNTLIVDHFAATGIPTFLIGMEGADYTGLEEMAVNAGADPHDSYCNGTDTGCSYYDVGNGDGTVLVDALEEIRQSVIGCQFALPTADQGLVDLDSIEVVFTPGGGATGEALSRFNDESSCGTSDGYYFDNQLSPTTILLCQETCSRAEADPDSTVAINLLCEGS